MSSEQNSDPLTLARLAALERLEQAATPAHWDAYCPMLHWQVRGPKGEYVIEHGANVVKANAEFIAAFRNDARALLALARRQVEQERGNG